MRALLLTLTTCLFALPATAKYGGGSGTAVDPYQIWTADQLNSIGTQRSDWDKCFKLMADIDLGGLGGASFNVIGVRPAYGRPFTGAFDGNGKTISNLTCTRSDMVSLGLFGGVQGTKAVVENLILKGVLVKAGTGGHVGALVGYLEGGKVSRCHVEGGSVSGRFSTGGLVGTSEGAVVNCSSSASVSASDLNGGGLIGRNGSAGTVASCCAAGQVSAGSQAGGLVAENLGSINDSYTTAQTSATTGSAGGLVASSSGTVQKCYSTGKVSAPVPVGGLVAVVSGKGSVTNSFWDVQTSGQSTSAGGAGRSTVQMKTAATFSGWDFASTWTIPDGLGYPTLQWEADLFPAPIATTIRKVSGDYQWALAGSKLPVPLVVCVKDQNGKPMANLHVDFTVVAGDSTIAPLATVTDPNGRASTVLTLGPTAGPSQVKVAAGTLSARFNVAALVPGYGGGAGTVNDPYQIRTAEQMHIIGTQPNDWSKRFQLMADIDLSEVYGVKGPWPFQMIAPGDDTNEGTPRFTGVFDGNKHTISRAIITGGNYSGLFGRLSAGAEIRDLGVLDVNVVAFGGYSGGLVGESSGAVTRCYSTGIVHGHWWRIAGLVGWNRGSVTQSSSTCAVIGNDYIGGLVGENGDDNLTRPATVTQCYSTGTVTSSFFGIGGLVGLNTGGQVTQCYSTGAVTGEQMVGGLVGWNSWGAAVSYCYSTGAVKGASRIGGLVGNNTGAVTFSYWDTQTSGYANSAGGTGKTTANLKKAGTFVGWDFTGVWTVNEGVDYPRLRMQPKYGGGTGAADNPYQIRTAEQMNALGANPSDWGKCFKLMADIDLSAFDGKNGRPAFNLIAPVNGGMGAYYWATPFNGVFDGNGHTISHLTITGANYLALFGYLESSAEIKDLGLVDVSVTATGSYVGALAGYSFGLVTRCYSTGVVRAGQLQVGGLVGYNRAKVIQCYSAAAVTGDWVVGGVVGENWGTVTACYSGGAVSSLSSWAGQAGGLIGGNYGTVTQCYSTGAVSGTGSVGGLIGAGGGGGRGSGSVGGRATGCFWDTQTSGQATSAGGAGKTTAEMHTAKTFLDAGWDFAGETTNGTEDIWWILEGQGYPHLGWETAKKYNDPLKG